MFLKKIKITFCYIFFLGIIFIFVCSLYFSRNIVRATSAPNIESLTLSLERDGASQSEINLIESSNVDVYLSGVFSDADGCGDVQNNGGTIQAILYRSGVDGGTECTLDKRNCYRAELSADTCSIGACILGTESTSTFECVMRLAYYAESTDISGFSEQNWIGKVNVLDSDYATGTLQRQIEINSLLAVDISEFLSYGQLSLGEITTTTFPMSITNTGNIVVDLEVFGTDMECTNGFIPVSAQHFSTLPDLTYEGMTSLSTSSQHVNLNLSQQISDQNLSTSSLYFKAAIPSVGIGGNCVGTNSVNAVMNQ